MDGGSGMGSRATAVLPLHGGRAPRWLFGRMVKLAACIVEIVVGEYARASTHYIDSANFTSSLR